MRRTIIKILRWPIWPIILMIVLYFILGKQSGRQYLGILVSIGVICIIFLVYSCFGKKDYKDNSFLDYAYIFSIIYTFFFLGIIFSLSFEKLLTGVIPQDLGGSNEDGECISGAKGVSTLLSIIITTGILYLLNFYRETWVEKDKEQPTLNDDDDVSGCVCSICGHDESKCDEEETYRRAKELIGFKKKASAALLQADLKISYSKASVILRRLEDEGIIGSTDGVKPRKVN